MIFKLWRQMLIERLISVWCSVLLIALTLKFVFLVILSVCIDRCFWKLLFCLTVFLQIGQWKWLIFLFNFDIVWFLFLHGRHALFSNFTQWALLKWACFRCLFKKCPVGKSSSLHRMQCKCGICLVHIFPLHNNLYFSMSMSFIFFHSQK